MKFFRIFEIIVSVQLISILAFAAVNEEKVEMPQVLATASKVDTPFVLAKDGTTPAEYYNAGVELQNSRKIEEAVKSYTQAVNKGKNDPILRSKAFQNIGVIQHESARAIMTQNPEECLKILDKAEQSYKESMKLHSRKDISVNQQILLNDRKKIEELIKNRKEMEQKKNEAREKTKEALDKQQQANQEKNKQDKPDKGDKGDNDTKQQPNIPDELPQNQSGQGEQKQYDSNDIPKDQAESVIKMMTDDEKSLNEALKDKEKESYGLQGVEKDW